MRTAIKLLSLVLLAANPLSTQTTGSTANGLALAAKSLAALCPAGAPTDVTLGGSATWTAGCYTDTGTITIEASSGGYSRVDPELAGGSRVSVRVPLGSRASSPGSLPGGAAQATGSLAAGSADSGGAAHQLPPGAVWTPAAWFFSRQLGSATSRAGARCRQLKPAPKRASGAAQRKVASHIRYGDWQQNSGIEVPHHIERWLNGTRQLAVTVNSVAINPTLAASDFHLGGAQ